MKLLRILLVTFIGIFVWAMVGGIGCSNTDESSADVDIDVDADSDADSDVDSDADVDSYHFYCGDNGGCDPLTTCIYSNGSVSCSDCPTGFTGTGETECIHIEEICEDGLLACVDGRSYQTCCTTNDCEDRFEDGTILVGSSASQGYCSGVYDGSEDGVCAGIASPCVENDTEDVCLRNAGCQWNADLASCTGNSDCLQNFSPQACALAAGCYWAPPIRGRVYCEPLRQTCVEGRRFMGCLIDVHWGSNLQYLVEDGTLWAFRAAVTRYCTGVIDREGAGICSTRYSGSCWLTNYPSECESKPNCEWVDDAYLCLGEGAEDAEGAEGMCERCTNKSCCDSESCLWDLEDGSTHDEF